MTTRVVTDARRALLERLIDHAPLFPPASLPLEEALADHQAALAGEAAWMVNRFVCPLSRVPELPDTPLRISVVVDLDVVEPGLLDERVEALELPPCDPGPAWLDEIYVETRPHDEVENDIDELATAGARAKVRCGGKTVPSISELAAFIAACRRHGVPFKATAGLHHAVRRNGEHGFLNLLAAAVFGSEEEALAEEDADAFALDATAFRWRDRVGFPAALATTRRDLFVSIGSCSFTEPVGELRARGELPQ